MPQRFVCADREQALLMPPSLREWLPADHLAWFVLDAVAEMDLAVFYGAYRVDGVGRPAHDPAMMVALVLYGYAVGERSSRGIERRCVEDVAFRVIAANLVPDHATIARFVVRHEEALAGLFSQVLSLCARAGVVRASMIAVDSTKLEADASGRANRGYEQIAKAIIAEGIATDAVEDERFGDRRGDELPAELADTRARRAWLREALRELEAQAAQRPPQTSRPQRLVEAKRRLDEVWRLECHAIDAHAAARERRHAELQAAGRKPIGRPPSRPLAAPAAPGGKINTTDPDSRPVKTPRGFIQGYNGQAVCGEGQIVIAAEVTTGTSDGGLLEPMVAAARQELANAGITEPPAVALADAGYWHTGQIHALGAEGIRVLVPPDGHARTGPPAKNTRGKLAAAMRALLRRDEARQLYRRRQAMIEPVFADTKFNRRAERFRRRGLAACRAEWRLITATHNLLKLWRATPAIA